MGYICIGDVHVMQKQKWSVKRWVCYGSLSDKNFGKKKICFCLVSTVLKRIWPHSVLLFHVGIRKENYQIQRKWRWWWMRNTVHYTTFQVSFCETYSNNPFLSFCLSLCKFPSFYLSLVYFSLSLSPSLLICSCWRAEEPKIQHILVDSGRCIICFSFFFFFALLAFLGFSYLTSLTFVPSSSFPNHC